jgi:hypothetical protein
VAFEMVDLLRDSVNDRLAFPVRQFWTTRRDPPRNRRSPASRDGPRELLLKMCQEI